MVKFRAGIDYNWTREKICEIPGAKERIEYWVQARDMSNGVFDTSVNWLYRYALNGGSNQDNAREPSRDLFNRIFEFDSQNSFEKYGGFLRWYVEKYDIDKYSKDPDMFAAEKRYGKNDIATRGRSFSEDLTEFTGRDYTLKGETMPTNTASNLNLYAKLLESNHNLIFTGAPGTGKTYLAKQMAIKMIFPEKEETELNEENLSDEEKKVFLEHYSFVQFHPSYDYTDFVEGLRAEETDLGVTFRLHNGTFKAFCKKAISENAVPINNFDEAYDKFINEFIESPVSFKTLVQKKEFNVEINSKKSCVAIPTTKIATPMPITKEMIRTYVLTGIIKDWKPYTTAIGEYFKAKYPLNTTTTILQENPLPYIFVIDEINRGEISKIFGELFFSIDPGYRGKDGKVMTQYANIQDDETTFDPELGKGWFYVPGNIYIIGTMNDIDRSVESFDFAMRRRFVWQEITAEESAKNMNLLEKTDENSASRMKSLNDAIEKTDGLGRHYQVGAAYFLKLENYTLSDGGYDHEKLWSLHLNPLLQEYVRSLPESKEVLAKLKVAYDLKAIVE